MIGALAAAVLAVSPGLVVPGAAGPAGGRAAIAEPDIARPDSADPDASGGVAARLVVGARRSIEKAPRYDGAYVPLRYPGGDPGWERGVCTDVVIRAFRHAGVDLQRLVHEDVVAAPRAYGIPRPDPSIDHRRARNLKVFFERHGVAIPLGRVPSGAREPTGSHRPPGAAGDPARPAVAPDAVWRPGDIVVWDLYGRGWASHIGIVSDRLSSAGRPLVIHHFPETAEFTGVPSEDDVLTRWVILGHYRWELGEVG